MAKPDSDLKPPPTKEQLEEARQRATAALLEAEREEASARRARRRATARMKHYERLLAEHNGAIPLPFRYEEVASDQTVDLRV
jgi:hypothetical protein